MSIIEFIIQLKGSKYGNAHVQHSDGANPEGMNINCCRNEAMLCIRMNIFSSWRCIEQSAINCH